MCVQRTSGYRFYLCLLRGSVLISFVKALEGLKMMSMWSHGHYDLPGPWRRHRAVTRLRSCRRYARCWTPITATMNSGSGFFSYVYTVIPILIAWYSGKLKFANCHVFLLTESDLKEFQVSYFRISIVFLMLLN